MRVCVCVCLCACARARACDTSWAAGGGGLQHTWFRYGFAEVDFLVKIHGWIFVRLNFVIAVVGGAFITAGLVIASLFWDSG